jgi:phosphopantetheinyl transferase (holo-ACP synthase)
MPLFKNELFKDVRCLIWRIDEEIDELKSGIYLHPSDQTKLNSFHHPPRMKEFFAIRQCLKVAFGNNPEVFYSENGKPYLTTKEIELSFSHTKDFAAIAISSKNIGLDIEVHQEKIKRIAAKFLRQEEAQSLSKEKEIPHLLAYWGAKEAVVKIEDDKKLDFKKEIHVEPFYYSSPTLMQVKLVKTERAKYYQMDFQEVGPLFVTIGQEIKHKSFNKR